VNRSRPFTLLGLAVVVASTIVLLSACGGSDKSATSDSTEAETTAETTINEDDQALAESSLLRLSDFPTGWRATKSDDDEDPNALEGCFTPDYAGVTVTGRAESEDFESGTSAQANSVTSVYATAAAAEKAVAQFTDGTLADCLVAYFEKLPEKDGVKFTDAEAGRLSFPALGDESDARQVVLEVEAQGLTPSAYVDLVAIRTGRAFSGLFFIDVFSPFSPDQEVELARKVETRMAAGG
jgi:hypothetical protein